jgi:hypothetical protein
MQRNLSMMLLVLMFSGGSTWAAADNDPAEQAGLDAACEAARQTALAPKRAALYQECIETFNKSAEVCETEVADYNGNRVNAGPLFYDLPECEAAFEYRNTHK